MAVDALMRNLKIPSKFMPYLEKHRIYELFYDLGNELAMLQPEDPISFIKECLERSDRVRDKRLVMILAPFDFDRIQFAQFLSAKTGYEMLSRYIMCGKSGAYLDPVALSVNTADYIRSSDREGWIFVDFPETKEEAKLLIKQKVLPTHTFLLLNGHKTIPNEENNDPQSIEDLSVVNECGKNTFELKEIFKSSLKVVKIKNKNLEEIVNLCVQLTKNMKPRWAPKLFRVALIGPKGSRRHTIAKLLQEKYNLVHVDIFHLINAARQLDNDLGDEIRRLERFKIPFSNKIILDLLKSRLGDKDCLERGYVLTNYPRSREDFVLLDSTETPPNKVIFIDIDSDVCKQKLEDRVINMYTGKVHSKKAIRDDFLLRNQTLTHPEDDLCLVEEELKFYDKHVSDLLDYCGKTGYVINGEGSVNSLLEKVEYALMSPSPTVKARSGRFGKQQFTSQEIPVAMSYPLSRIQVVPLIDSEELISRFRELKRISRNDLERHSKSSSVSWCTCDEPIYRVLSSRDGLLEYDDDYCTCDEPLFIDDDFCVCDEPLFIDEGFCICDEPLCID